ncbi:MAG: hypothetical protein LBJ57_01935 [Prevotellaceae bacterium]|jgi:hypothetical protein|nr:hypothetical protein [Prevotellaceae bacterium]
MNEKQYISKELEALVTKFPNVCVRYEFDEKALIHCVEVIPREVYCSNEGYISWENEMTDQFIKLFPAQSICFISDDAFVGIENAELTLCGETYAQASLSREHAASVPFLSPVSPAKKRKAAMA